MNKTVVLTLVLLASLTQVAQAGLAPRGIPRYEKGEAERKADQLQLAESGITVICESYFQNLETHKVVAAIGDAIVQIDIYRSLLDVGQPERILADAARDELSFVLSEGVKEQFAKANHYESSIRAYCRK